MPVDGRTNLSPHTRLVLVGEPIPDGTDAVVPVEHVQSVGDGLITQRGVRPSEHVVPRGHLVPAGGLILDRGTMVTPVVLGLIASLGERSLLVHPRPRVALLGLSQRRSSPRRLVPDPSIELLHALATDAGADVVVADGLSFPWQTLIPALHSVAGTADLILITPGPSRLALERVLGTLGTVGRPIVRDPAILPGRHTSAWLVSRRPVLVLAGPLADILVGFEALGRPALALLAGDPVAGGSCIPARAASHIVHHPGRTEFVPVILGRTAGTLVASPLGWSHDADLRGATRADAFAVFEPMDRSVDADAEVCVRATHRSGHSVP